MYFVTMTVFVLVTLLGFLLWLLATGSKNAQHWLVIVACTCGTTLFWLGIYCIVGFLRLQ